MRRRYILTNKTGWRTDHLRAFVVRAARQVFDDDAQPIINVTFRPRKRSRFGRGIKGLASIGGANSQLWLPADELSKVSLAYVLAHEFGHNAGHRHDTMHGVSRWDSRVPGWEKSFQWANDLSLEKKPPRAAKQRPSGPALAETKLQGVQAALKRWQVKAKRAATAIKKYRAKERYYQRRLELAANIKPTEEPT